MDQTRVLNKTLREIKDTLDGIQGGVSIKQFSEVLAVVASYLEKPKGDKGDSIKGDPGYTPVKGVDYFDGDTPVKGKDYYTEEEQRVLVEKVYGLIHTPVKGSDYYTEAEKKEIIDSAVKMVQQGIYSPTRGVDYMNEEDKAWIAELIKAEVPNIPPVDTSKFVIGVGTKTLTVSKTQPENMAEGDLWVQTE